MTAAPTADPAIWTGTDVAAVLNRAADHIEKYGHHKGSGFAESHTTETAACVHGALIAVTMGTPDRCEEAVAVFRDHLGQFGIADWNDATERTACEVVEALRAAAIIAAAEATDVRTVAPESWLPEAELVPVPVASLVGAVV